MTWGPRRRTVGDGHVLFEIQEPAAGQWFMEVSTARETHTRYTAACFVRSPIRILVARVPKVLVPGQALGIVLRAFDGKAPLSSLRASGSIGAPVMGLPSLLIKYKAQLVDRCTPWEVWSQQPTRLPKIGILSPAGAEILGARLPAGRCSAAST